jgi:hypothetical protein
MPGPINRADLRTRQAGPNDDSPYPAQYIDIPVDHFHNDSRYAPHSNATYKNRYWFDASHYKPGGPVIVLQGGETDGSGRLIFLVKGIVYQLAKALGGIGVIFEHRYYGESFPTSNLTTKNMRFLSTDQGVADMAYFAQHVKFPGMEHMNLTSATTPYLAYGGSYAGGMVAFLRKLYPNVYYGAISSSGVTYAVYDFWNYYEPVREYAEPTCVANQIKLMDVLDTIYEKGTPAQQALLTKALGMTGLTGNANIAFQYSGGIGWWQSRNWDPEVNSPEFDWYCGNITSSTLLWPKAASLTTNATNLIKAGGWGNETTTLLNPMLNFLAWTKDSVTSSCDDTLNSCYNYNNASAPRYTYKNVSNYGSLSWNWQVCNEWGYIQDGSNVPTSAGSPLISRLLTIPYLTQMCRYAFNITASPKVNLINKYGGFNISYPRLMFVGGEADVWRPVTPLATLSRPDQLNRTSTADEPTFLIQGAVHHWVSHDCRVDCIIENANAMLQDENGLFPNETTADMPPAPVKSAQAAIASAAMGWMADWNKTHS